MHWFELSAPYSILIIHNLSDDYVHHREAVLFSENAIWSIFKDNSATKIEQFFKLFRPLAPDISTDGR